MQLHFRRYGAGPPLLILHGLFGSLNNWHSFARSLEHRCTVFAIDLRNHGASPHDPVSTYAAMADDVRTFVQTHALPTVHLLGHSMGGKVAMQLCAVAPDIVDHLVVVDIAPRRYAPGHDEVLEALGSFQPASCRTREEADTALARHLHDPAARQFLLANLVRDTSGGLRWRMNAAGLQQAYPHLLAPVHLSVPFSSPSLFIRGGRSQYILSTDETSIRRMFPSARIVTIPDAGHWVHVDNPEGLREAVLGFLA